VFKLPDTALFGIALIKTANRGLGINFKLSLPTEIDLSQFAEFEFELNDDKYKGRLFTPIGPPPQLGEDIIVTVKKTAFHFDTAQVASCLSNFGTIAGTLEYKPIDGLQNIREDTIEVLMKLNRHIPSILPLFGKRLYTNYRGQPILCGNCFHLGHVRKECKNQRANWKDYVQSLMTSLNYPVALLGTWRSLIAIEK